MSLRALKLSYNLALHNFSLSLRLLTSRWNLLSPIGPPLDYWKQDWKQDWKQEEANLLNGYVHFAGHSKWANIQHRKARQDLQAMRVNNRHVNAIMATSKKGGPDPSSNSDLKEAITRARADNVSKDVIERAVSKGQESGAMVKEIFEIKGHGGAAFLLEAEIDDKSTQRIHAKELLNNIFRKNGGTCKTGLCLHFFQRQGIIKLPKACSTEDKLLELATEGGADDLTAVDDEYHIITQPNDYAQVRKALEASGFADDIIHDESGVIFVPKEEFRVELTSLDLAKNKKLLEKLFEMDYTASIFHNLDQTLLDQ